MDDLARAEYPAMLATLQPGQAVHTLMDRVKRVNRINVEVADWLQERRRVEEQYVQGLRKLSQFKVPNGQSELGVFQAPWNRIVESVEVIARSHHELAERIEKDVEHPLRNFQHRKDYQNMTTISTNLSTMAKDLEEAQSRTDKLSKKGAKANTQKVDAAVSQLEAASQQWESQAPFIFETLQALDELRVNQLRDLLTQYQTHESDQAQRTQDHTVQTLALMLEIDPDAEIQSFVSRTTGGRAKLPPTRASTRQSSMTGSTNPAPTQPSSAPVTTPAPPSTAGSTNQNAPSFSAPRTPPEDGFVDQNAGQPAEGKAESKLRRFGTMLGGGRRRQSMHAGFGQLSPQKGTPGFGRLGSSHGRAVSPHPSTTNLQDTGRLSSLAETNDAARSLERETSGEKEDAGQEKTNGVNHGDGNLLDSPIPAMLSSSRVNGTQEVDVSDVPPPPGPPPSRVKQTEEASQPGKDSDGFNIPPPMNDPISEAQKEAAGEEADQFFTLNIQNQPVEDEDPQAKEAALSSVVNTLKMGPATRRSGTVRGRRDVRNTIYVPPPMPGSETTSNLPMVPSSPPLPASFSRSGAAAALASEASIAGTSDTQSVRSGNSLGNLAHAKHPDMAGPGLNTSIIETVSAVFEDGVIKSASVAGEIAFVNNPAESGDAQAQVTIRINNFPNLERIGPNRIFVQNSSAGHPDQFSMDVSHLSKMSTAFSYRVFAEESEAPTLSHHAPLMLKVVWKPQGDKLGLLLQYQLNPESKLTGPVTLHNVVYVATYEGRASGAQTKPTGTHLKDKHLVYWRLGDVTLTTDAQKIVCRIIGAEGIEPKPGHIEARWELIASGPEAVGSGISISKLDEGKGKGKEVAEDDPFADDDSTEANLEHKWVDVPMSRRLVSGKYEAR